MNTANTTVFEVEVQIHPGDDPVGMLAQYVPMARVPCVGEQVFLPCGTYKVATVMHYPHTQGGTVARCETEKVGEGSDIPSVVAQILEWLKTADITPEEGSALLTAVRAAVARDRGLLVQGHGVDIDVPEGGYVADHRAAS